jgi:hypothetical protein
MPHPSVSSPAPISVSGPFPSPGLALAAVQLVITTGADALYGRSPYLSHAFFVGALIAVAIFGLVIWILAIRVSARRWPPD